jgi:hypothetical protein
MRELVSTISGRVIVKCRYYVVIFGRIIVKCRYYVVIFGRVIVKCMYYVKTEPGRLQT